MTKSQLDSIKIRVDQHDREIASLKQENDELRKRIERLEKLIESK